MEGDKTADNEKELTSTSSSDMDKLLSTNKEDKNDSNDTLPTSSTDASTSVKLTHLVSDDPISSTSSEMDSTKSKTIENTSTHVLDKASTFQTEVELLDMSMATQPTERIEENVDDLVSDLETLLGESAEPFSLPFKTAEASEKTEAISAVEEISNLPEDKPENEVSSNTDSSPDKNLNEDEPAFSEVEKREQETVQDDISHKLEDGAKDVNGGGDFKSSDDNSGQDSTQPQKLDVIESVKGDSENIKESPKGYSEEVCLKEIANIENFSTAEPGTNLTTESKGPIEGTSSIIEKVAESPDDKSSECLKNVATHDCTEKTEEVNSNMSLEAKGPETGHCKIVKDTLEEVCEKDTIESVETSVVESKKETQLELVENKPTYTTEDVTDKNVQVHVIEEISEVNCEPEQTFIKPNEDSSKCEGNTEINQSPEKSSVENIQDSVHSQPVEESNQSSNIVLQDQCQERRSGKGTEQELDKDVDPPEEDTEQIKEENDQKDNFNIFHQEEQSEKEHRVQTFCEEFDNSGVTNQDTKAVQEINEGAEEVEASNICASTEESSNASGKKTETLEVIKDVTEREENEVKKIEGYPEVSKTIEPTETENDINQQGQDSTQSDLNNPPDSSPIISEELVEGNNLSKDINASEIVEVTDDVGILRSDNNKHETEEIEIAENDEHNEKIADLEKLSSQPKVDLEVPSKTSEEQFEESITFNELKETKADFQETTRVSCEEKAETSKDSRDSQQECPDEDNCESVQDAFGKDADIAESGQDSQNVDKTDDQSQDTSRSPPEEIKISEQSQDTSKSLPEEIEISELAETSAPAGEAEVIELEPVIEEPEENTQYSSEAVNEEPPNAEIIEVKESENKLPLIFEDLKDNHEDLTNIASTEKPGSSIEKCKKDEEIVEASENVGKKTEGEVTSDKKDSITTEFLEKESESDEVVKVVEETSFKQVDIEDKLTNEVDPDSSDIIVLNEMTTQEDSVASKEELDASEKNKSCTEEQNPGKNEVKYDEETNMAVSEPNDKIEDFTGTLKGPKENEQEIIENVSLEPEIVSLHTETSEETCSEGKEKAFDKKDTADENNENSRKTIELMEVGAPVQVSFNSALHKDKNKEFVDNMDVGDVYVDKNKESVEVGAIEEGININAKEIKADSDCLEKVIKEASFVATKTFDRPVTVNLCEQESKSKGMVGKSFKENFFTPRDTDISEAKKNKRKIGIVAKHVQEIKPTPEINIRRKTVEQDLEKVVCLSEESSDSDTNEEVTKSLSTLIADSKDPDFEQDPVIHDVPLTDDLPPNQEESALIQIAQEVEKLQNVQINELVPNIHSNENTPCIEDILSDQPQEIPVDAGENLETILAVASLQNDPVTEVKVERRLSEKELREMEAIRMAVASITDSSQDTYDSYLVESSMTMESSIPEGSSDVQEFSNDVQELSNDTQELSSDVQILSDDTQNLTEFEMKDGTIITDNSREVVVDQHSILPDDDLEKEAKNKTEKNINKDIVNKYVSKTEETDRSDLSPTHDAASDVKDIEEADNHPTPNDEKDMTQQPSSSDTKESEESLNAENIRETTDIRDVSEPSKVLSPEQSIKKNDDVISDQDKQKELSVSDQLKETAVAITEQVEQAEDKKTAVAITEQVEQAEESKGSISKEDVKSNETPELKQSVNKKEDLLSDDVCADKVSAPEQVVEETNVTTTRVVVEEQEISISKGTVEEVIDKPEPVVSENKISTSENVKENETAPLPVCEEKVILSQPAIEKDIGISQQVVQDKKVTTPKHIEDNEIDASKQEVEEKDIVTPKHVEEKKVLTLEEDVKEKQISSSEPTKEKEILTPNQVVEEKEVLSPEDKKVLTSEPVVKGNEVLVPPQIIEERTLRNRTRRGNKVSEPLSISVEEVEKKEKPYSPKVTIKPVKVPDEEVSTTSDAEGNKGSLKITITKQSDKMHSILKVYNPDDDPEPSSNQEEPIPKLIIKPKMQQVEQQHSPKMSTRSSKVYSPTSTQRCSSPRVTIKPVVKPTEAKTEAVSPLKITFKPVVKPDEASKKHSPKTSKEPDQKNHNPKITIKPIPKPTESDKEETSVSTPKVTIKPIKRHIEDNEVENEHERSSPKITIKPVVKPAEQDADHTNQSTPKLKIKPIKKHEDEENSVVEKDRDSPKISFKPVVKPAEADEEDEEVKERIVLKINKGNLPTPSKESRKREYPEDEKTEKMGKLKLKFSTTGGQTHIVQEVEEGFKRQRKDSGYAGKKDIQNIEEVSNKRTSEDKLPEKNKRLRSSITPDKINEDTNDDVKILGHKLDSPIVISEDSRSQHSADCVIIEDSQSNSSDISKISDIASRTTHIEATPVVTVGVVTPSVSPAPKKRGRPRKVPLEVREELKDLPTTPPITPLATPQSTPVTETSILTSDKSEPGTPITTPSPGGRPKRSCRGQNVIATLGIKPRKPRGRGMGRGSKVNMGDREPVVQSPVEPVQTVTMKPEKEPKLSKAKLKLIQKAAEEAKRQKEDAIKQEEEAETARESQKEEEKVKQEEAVEQKEDDGKINLELKKKQEEEQLCKKQEEGAQRELSEQNLKFGEEEEKKVEIVKEQKQKVIEIETKSFQLEQKTQKGLDERRQKEIEEQAILEAEETHRKQDEVLKRKKEEGEGQTPPKKKKEDKTPPRKLEVTTRRQKAQLQKAAEEAEKAAAEAEKTGAENKKTEAKRSVGNPKNLSPKKVAALEPTTSADSSCSDTATILLDIKEEREEEENKLEVEKDSPKEKGKKTPEQKGKGKNTLDKVKKALEKAKLEEEKKAEEEEERKVEEQKKADEQRKAEQERKADEEKRKAEEEKKAAEEERKAAEEKKALEEKKAALEEKKAAEEKKALEEKKAAEEKALDEKKAAEKKALDERNAALKKLLEENKDDTKTESKKSEEAPGDKKSEASAEDDEESEDSEVERQRELIKQKKQEAIKKCRAKRMEKLAKAAEMKRKRQEQAAQQRAARMAAEEAERIAAEKARVNRRYGRYGNPKPQISLIDEPVRETAGTIKSPMGLFNPQTEQIMIRQPIVIDDDSNFAEKPLKQLDVTLSSSSYKLLAPPTSEPMAVDSTEETPTKHRRPIGSEDIMMVDEETRMSADFRGSRAQTPAKQPIAPPETMIEDSQGSNGTESVGGKSKSSKAPKMEVFQDLESIQVTAEQLAEYSWNGRGPFMIQEQVSLFLGIKSFKRKYPNCQRRTVDMQERDYLKENGFVTEAQCDLGLTAVNAQDILDIMYADFQDKYEEYCKVQREKQDRELANKQKALSQFTFKPGYEKLDIIEQAVQSAAAWNQQFNKTRREERKAHMDLQNLTVHYPKTKVKVIPTQKIGDHPIALVPGQFTDYYKAFTPTELNNLPLNTMCYDEIKVPGKDSDSDDSSSGSDSDSDSSSDSSCSSSSCDEDCKECVKHGNAEVNGNVGNDVTMDNNGSNDSVVLVSVTTPA